MWTGFQAASIPLYRLTQETKGESGKRQVDQSDPGEGGSKNNNFAFIGRGKHSLVLQESRPESAQECVKQPGKEPTEDRLFPAVFYLPADTYQNGGGV